MKLASKILVAITLLAISGACNQGKPLKTESSDIKEVTAKEILGNPDYLAISYGGYRQKSREFQPTIAQLKEDLRILHAMGIRLIRTYNVQLPHAPNIVKAISELKVEEPGFEMYVMLGAWIDCKNAWTEMEPDHNVESEKNAGEIERAVKLVNQYPDVIKILAIGNEAMVRWATSYFVQPDVILKWVNHCQELKNKGDLPKDLWITSSDDFSSWGGGDPSYRTEDLKSLIKAVDFISMHTYPYHNTHYNPQFWIVPDEEQNLSDIEKVDAAMLRALNFAKAQYKAVSEFVQSVDSTKTIHIGETGWATVSNGHYGPKGSQATDEYKQAKYYQSVRNWTNSEGISCFYFEAFNEPWKEDHNPKGSENHFGLFTVDGKAKYPVWDLVDKGVFNGLSRNGNQIKKTYGGKLERLIEEVQVPPTEYDPALVH